MADLHLPLTAERIISMDSRVPAFPRVAAGLLALIDNDDADSRELVDYLRLDAGLSAQLVGMANAAGVRPSREPVRDLRTAVAVNGVHRVRQLVLSVSVMGAFRALVPAEVFADFQEHAVDAGMCAQVLAEHHRLDPEVAYVSGLIHDVGQLWLTSHCPDDYAQVTTRHAANPARELVMLEREVLGMDHAEVGGVLAHKWNLPEAMASAIRDHHGNPGMSKEPMVLLVHLAQNVSEALGIEADPIHYVSPEIESVLHPDWDLMPELFGEIEARARQIKAELHQLLAAFPAPAEAAA